MKISSRFSEYGMTGAFFWLLQLFILYLYWEAFPGLITTRDFFPDSPGIFIEVLSIISIFFTGLLLDTIGVVMLFFEVKIFCNYIGQNQPWLKDLSDRKDDPFLKNMLNFHEEYGVDFFIFKPLHLLKRLRLAGSFNKSQTYLVSYVMVHSGEANPDLLFDRINQWRTVRAMTSVLLLMTIENLVLILSDKKIHVLFNDHEGKVFLTSVCLTVLAAIVTCSNYRSMCDSLFSLTYASSNK